MTVADRFNKFIEDIKTDKKVQTLTAGIVFFLIAFPSVFAVMANGGSEGGAMGGVGTYNVSDTITNIPFDSGEQEISNGEDFMIDLNTDEYSIRREYCWSCHYFDIFGKRARCIRNRLHRSK